MEDREGKGTGTIHTRVTGTLSTVFMLTFGSADIC